MIRRLASGWLLLYPLITLANHQVELILFKPTTNPQPVAKPEFATASCPKPRLRELWQKLSASPTLQPLQHLCWQQSLVTQSQTEAMVLDFDGFKGKLKVFSGRQIHVQWDAELSPPWLAPGQRHRIQQDQRLTLDQPYYLDSPELGVLLWLSGS